MIELQVVLPTQILGLSSQCINRHNLTRHISSSMCLSSTSVVPGRWPL